ncbi:MAG: histidine kinase [Deltaproteobacteria bacterium]|nr:MAG: histidine kinase [Deltaproteobacteria bacterium]
MTSSSKSPASLVTGEITHSLEELLDIESVVDVCRSYADLFGIGLKLLGADGQVLVDAKAGGDFCSYLFGFTKGKELCTKDVGRIRQARVDYGQVKRFDCFTGLRYLIQAICLEGDPLGKLVLGPYRPAENDEMRLPQLGPKYRQEVAQRLWGQLRRVADDVARKVSAHLVTTLEVMLHIGYKQALTSSVHVEAVTASYNELQRKNQALQESYERLKELDRLKSNFLATVSHELRTPLTSVIGYSEMLIEGLAGPLNPEQLEYVKTIMEKGDQLLQIISSMLDFSKMELGAIRLDRKPTNIVETVRSALSTLMPAARKEQVQVVLKAQPNMPKANVDENKLRQVLVNIIGNAIKFNRKGGKVEVTVSLLREEHPESKAGDLPAALAPQYQEFVSIAVADEGIGIPEEQHERIFDSFYQVDGSSTREYGGTGLGLAIAKRITEAHGGKIKLQSEPNRGSTFTVLIPRD